SIPPSRSAAPSSGSATARAFTPPAKAARAAASAPCPYPSAFTTAIRSRPLRFPNATRVLAFSAIARVLTSTQVGRYQFTPSTRNSSSLKLGEGGGHRPGHVRRQGAVPSHFTAGELPRPSVDVGTEGGRGLRRIPLGQQRGDDAGEHVSRPAGGEADVPRAVDHDAARRGPDHGGSPFQHHRAAELLSQPLRRLPRRSGHFRRIGAQEPRGLLYMGREDPTARAREAQDLPLAAGNGVQR